MFLQANVIASGFIASDMTAMLGEDIEKKMLDAISIPLGIGKQIYLYLYSIFIQILNMRTWSDFMMTS